MKRLVLLGLVLLSVNAVYAQEETKMISQGKTVKFDYTLTVMGDVVDTSQGKEPLEYVHGNQMLIPGLEKEMEGLKVGDEKEVVIAPEDAYGSVDPRAIVEIPKANLDPAMNPEKGMMLQMQTQDGKVLPGIIEEVKDETVIVNFNHPLAGQELKFDIKIVEIK